MVRDKESQIERVKDERDALKKDLTAMKDQLQVFEALNNQEFAFRQAAEVDLAVSLCNNEEQKQQLLTQIGSMKVQHQAQANDLNEQLIAAQR